MSDLKEAFPISADDSTGAGIVPISRVAGDASAGKAGIIGFAFKDASGNVVLPALRADNALPVFIDPEVDHFQYGTNAGSLTSQDLATIVGTLAKKYHDFRISCSCFRETLFTLVYIDDVGGTPVETVMGKWRTGPGQYTIATSIPGYKDLTAGTGVQNFVLRGMNLDHASTMDASLHCKEMI